MANKKRIERVFLGQKKARKDYIGSPFPFLIFEIFP
jgi:hypothetical protein